MTTLPDYKDDADAYEREERARPDEMAMIHAVAAAARRHLDRMSRAMVLDLCCGTGLPLVDPSNHPHLERLLGVDNSEPYLAFARRRFACNPRVSFVCADAVTAPVPNHSWNIIIMASAYHHIEDQRKLEFMERVHALLAPGGVAVVGENILPPYVANDRSTYVAAVRLFYDEVLKTADEAGKLPDDVRGLIQRVAQYGSDGDYEYKTDLTTFLEFVTSAGLSVAEVKKVWPESGRLCLTTGGNYVFILQAAR